MTLLSLKKSSKGVITGFSGDAQWLERLSELGLYQGMVVKVIDKVPFGGPLVVQAGRFFIALREEEAQCVTVSTNP